MNLVRNLYELITRIEKVRGNNIIKLVVSSKYVDSESIASLYRIGQRAFGENRVQDVEKKAQELDGLPIEWHFMGRIQRNKLNALAKIDIALIQSIDSLETALEVDKRFKNIRALLQINSAFEESKAGVMPELAVDIYSQIKEQCKNINLCGVMSIGAHSEDEVVVQKSFETTHKIYEQLKGATICSMGMSGDFELAIKCGSNMIRVGSLLFKG